jgi:hypothetical protein
MTEQPTEPVVVGEPPAEPTRRTRSSVSAQTDPRSQPQQPPTGEGEGPVLVEVEHTPTLKIGEVSNYSIPASDLPIGAPVAVVDDPTQPAAEADPHAQALAGALVSAAAPQLEIAAPAPLPRPGDEQLTRGTAAHAILQEQLTGEAPVHPADPNSEEAKTALADAYQADLEQRQEAAEAAVANQQTLLDNSPKVQTGQPGQAGPTGA